MNAHVNAVAIECTRASDAGTITFLEVVGKLNDAGVEHYLADLVRLTRTYYMPDGETYVVESHGHETKPANDFSADGLVAALREIQARKINYLTFCEKILASGCIGYIVSITGRRAVYFGRSGETYVEMFPAAQ